MACRIAYPAMALHGLVICFAVVIALYIFYSMRDMRRMNADILALNVRVGALHDELQKIPRECCDSNQGLGALTHIGGSGAGAGAGAGSGAGAGLLHMLLNQAAVAPPPHFFNNVVDIVMDEDGYDDEDDDVDEGPIRNMLMAKIDELDNDEEVDKEVDEGEGEVDDAEGEGEVDEAEGEGEVDEAEGEEVEVDEDPSADAAAIVYESLRSRKVDELRRMLRERGADWRGNKDVLVERLVAASSTPDDKLA